MTANQSALNTIYTALLNGEEFGEFVYWDYYNNKPMRYPYFRTVLYKHDYKSLFCWSSFGSSANKATKKDVAWIIKEIFQLDPKTFVAKYMTKTEFNRMKKAVLEGGLS